MLTQDAALMKKLIFMMRMKVDRKKTLILKNSIEEKTYTIKEKIITIEENTITIKEMTNTNKK